MKAVTYCIAALQCMFLVCCLVLTSGVTYYVETTGTFEGDGSSTNPWPTVGHALGASGPGDTIEIGAGEFREFLLITNSVTLNGQNTYSPGNPPLARHNSITELRAPSAESPDGPVITVMTNNVTIQNLTIYGDHETNAVGSVQVGIYTAHRPITVYKCKIANIYGRGIECVGSKPAPAPSDNDAHRSYLAYNLISNISHSDVAAGIYLESTQATVEFNELSGIGEKAHAGIFVSHCDFTAGMSEPIIIRSNFLNDCAQGIWASDPVSDGETLQLTGNTITNSLIGIRLSSAAGQALIDWNNIHVSGLSASGLTPARGIWIQADQSPWNSTTATDHVVCHNTLISEAVTNDGTIGMFFSYDTQPPGGNNNGVRATVLTNYIYNFAIGSMISSGSNGVSVQASPLVDVEFHYNDIYGSAAAAILTTGFAYTVDATTNFLGYTDPSNAVSSNVIYTGWTYGSLTIDTDGDASLDYVDDDDDGDGMNDTNEYAIGTSPTLKDTDGDGMKDPDEHYVAGTDPLDASSVFAMNSFSWTSTNGASFEWPSVTGRTYHVFRTTNLVSGFGGPITNYPPSSAPTRSFTDNAATGALYFYQISVTN